MKKGSTQVLIRRLGKPPGFPGAVAHGAMQLPQSRVARDFGDIILTVGYGSPTTVVNQKEKPATGAFTVRVADDTFRKLDLLAGRLDRSRAWVATQAITDFVEREAWQLAEIEAGLAGADCGAFASSADVAAVVAKYAVPARPS